MVGLSGRAASGAVGRVLRSGHARRKETALSSSNPAPAERLASLLGRWRALRVVLHAGGPRARFIGEAVWAPEGVALRCVEEGVLEHGGARYPARRETLWRAGPAGIAVAFADGRPFHLIEGRHGLHACPPDLYRFAYDFSARGFWSVRWHVTGPRKDYRATTRYVRR